MDDLLLYSTIVGVLVVILIGLLFAKNKSTSGEDREKSRHRRNAVPKRNEDGEIVANPEMMAAAGPRGRRGPRMVRRTPQAVPAGEEDHNDDDIDDDENEGGPSKLKTDGKIGKKKLAKLQVRLIGLRYNRWSFDPL